jgi:hypothetical protein
MSVIVRNALKLLKETEVKDSKIQAAQDLLESFQSGIEKKAFINNVTLNNVINLLTPFVVNYKVNQVIKLLKELQKESVDPSTGYRKYF